MTEDEALKARLAETEAELRALRERLESATAEKEALERAHEARRAEQMAAPETSLAFERLESRLRDLEYRHDTAYTRFVDEARSRDSDMRLLIDEVAELHRGHDDMMATIATIEHACKVLAVRLHKAESGGMRGTKTAMTGQSLTARLGATGPATTAPGTATAGATTTAPKRPAAPAMAAPTSSTDSSIYNPREISGIVHFEPDPQLREVVRAIALKWSLEYFAGGESLNPSPSAPRILVMNLLQPEHHPIVTIQNARDLGVASTVAFTYCAEGTRGAEFGVVEYLCPPFTAERCAEYLLGRTTRPQRLLFCSEEFEVMNRLKEMVASSGCAVSMAFDARQALDLAPMIKADLALVDLNLPKGEALRLVSRVRATASTSRLPFALLWRKELDRAEFQEHAKRAIRDLPFAPDDLSRALSRVLIPGRTAMGA